MADAETVQWVSVTTTKNQVGDVTSIEAGPVPVLALVAARSADEPDDSDRPAVIVGKTLYLLDPAVVPGASDWFTLRGDRYEVVGDAHRWGSSGVEVAVRRAKAKP